MASLTEEYVALSQYVTLKTGGAARYLITATTPEEVTTAVLFAQQTKLPLFVLGGGSNLLVSDDGFPGVVIHMKLLGRTYTEIDSNTVLMTVAAGEELDAVVAQTTSQNLWGLENLSHIPGSVGATPIQNVGAYGVEVSDVISEVTVFDIITKKIIVMKNDECAFSYRHSIFKEKNNLIVLSVTFLLSKIPSPKISYADLASVSDTLTTPQAIRDTVITIRAQKFPNWNVVGTAGSFFKNPIIDDAHAQALHTKYPDIPMYPEANGMVKISLGYILDKICGLKGFAIGPVRLFEKQALVLVAEAGATTTDIKKFRKIILDTVLEKTSLHISQEVTEI